MITSETISKKLMETITGGEWSYIKSYGDESHRLFFHQTENSLIYNYLWDKLEIEEDYAKGKIKVIYDIDVGVLNVYFGACGINTEKFRKIDMEAYIDIGCGVPFRGICLNLYLNNMMAEEIKNSFPNLPVPYRYCTGDELNKMFLYNSKIETMLVKEYEHQTDDGEDTLVLTLDTDLRKCCQLHRYELNDKNKWIRITAESLINRTTRISSVIIKDYSKHCSFDMASDKGDVVLYYQIGHDCYGFDLNPLNNKYETVNKYFYEIR